MRTRQQLVGSQTGLAATQQREVRLEQSTCATKPDLLECPLVSLMMGRLDGDFNPAAIHLLQSRLEGKLVVG